MKSVKPTSLLDWRKQVPLTQTSKLVGIHLPARVILQEWNQLLELAGHMKDRLFIVIIGNIDRKERCFTKLCIHLGAQDLCIAGGVDAHSAGRLRVEPSTDCPNGKLVRGAGIGRNPNGLGFIDEFFRDSAVAQGAVQRTERFDRERHNILQRPDQFRVEPEIVPDKGFRRVHLGEHRFDIDVKPVQECIEAVAVLVPAEELLHHRQHLEQFPPFISVEDVLTVHCAPPAATFRARCALAISIFSRKACTLVFT